MRFIAFDAAKRKTGWAFIDGETTHFWTTGVIAPHDTKALREIVKRAVDVGVDTAVIENCFLGKNFNTAKALNEAQVRIKLACEEYELPIHLVYPQTWQSAFAIKGTSPERKSGALKVAKGLGAKESITEDEADAVCLCSYMTTKGFQSMLESKTTKGKSK